MKKELDTTLPSLVQLLTRTTKLTFHLLVIASFIFSIVLGIGLWTNSQMAIDIVVLGVSPASIFMLVAFALALPLAHLLGALVKLFVSIVQAQFKRPATYKLYERPKTIAIRTI